MKKTTAMLFAGAVISLTAAQSIGIWADHSPSIAALVPLLLILPVVFGIPVPTAILSVVLLFWMWRSSLFSGEPSIPRRTVAAPSFARSLATHLVLFAWLFSYAFPYLGETL